MNKKTLNTNIEVALRVLFLFDALNDEIDFERLVFYDYALLHSDDFDANQKGLIPASPFRKEELNIKAKIMQNALDLLAKKQLIDISFTESGIFYKKNQLTKLFLKNFSSAYCVKLKDKAKWVKKHFKKYNDQKLKIYFDSTFAKWKSEFSTYGLYSEDYINAR